MGVGCTISKKFSCWMWNCGKTIAASRFKTKETDIVWLHGGPIYSPILTLGFHFDILPPACRQFWRAYTGHPKVWFSLRLGHIYFMVKLLTDHVSYSLSSKMLKIWLAWISSYSYRYSSTALDHISLAWCICLLIFSCKSLILFFYSPFCKWALTPHNEIVYI